MDFQPRKIFNISHYLASAMKIFTFIFLSFFCLTLNAQNYTSYFTGSVTDVITQPAGGVCLMGGATEDDNAMTWFLEQANGGDILILRASGSDGYNDYFYTDLGVTVNSVETIVFNDATASSETYIHQKIEQAEAIWFAGGDQWNYISYWRNTAIDSLINIAIAERKIVIGGTSAGMAILGEVYFTAENGTISSATALSNPYSTTATIDSADFLNVPYMDHIITDTHYDNPDRRGRHVVFMAKMLQNYDMMPHGIACEEYVAVCVDTFGIARVYGGYPAYDEQAYFIRVNCELNDIVPTPEVCAASTPLTWSMGESVLSVYKVNGTSTGANYFDLNTWQTGAGGEWQHWSVEAGVFSTTVTTQPNCSVSLDEFPQSAFGISIYPNPTNLNLSIVADHENIIQFIEIVDISGRIFQRHEVNQTELKIETDSLEPGVYFLKYSIDDSWNSVKFVVK